MFTSFKLQGVIYLMFYLSLKSNDFNMAVVTRMAKILNIMGKCHQSPLPSYPMTMYLEQTNFI